MASTINPVIAVAAGRGVYAEGAAPLPVEDSDSTTVRVSQLNQRHPEYEARYEAWLDLALLYEGGAALKARASRLLKKRPREDEEVYAARLDRFTYQNILGTGLGWYGAAMFDTSPEIFFNGKEGNDFYSNFLEDCDGIGTNFVDFWKKVFQYMLTYGSAWVLTDVRALEENEEPPATLKEEQDRGLKNPHPVPFTPLNVINWRTDARGELIWAVVKTSIEEQPFLGQKEIVDTWYYYDREEFRVYQDRKKPEENIRVVSDESGRTAKLIRQGKHPLSQVKRLPIRRITLSQGLWLANRAYLLLIDHLNQDNTLAWSLFMSNLAIPIIIGDVDTSNMTTTENGYLQFPSGTTYEWSEPEGKSFTHSAKRVEALREECFRSMNLQAQGRSMRATPAMQSGKSKQLEMAPSKQILSGMGDDLRKYMQDVLTDVCDARGEDNMRPDVRGFTFQEDMTTEEVFAVNSVLGIRIPSETFERYLYKKVVKAWMPDANREELAKVYKEIDAGPTMEEREQKEMEARAESVRASIRGALSTTTASSKSDGPPMPPGRGGAGPSPKTPQVKEN